MNQPGAVQLMTNIATANVAANGGPRPGAVEKVNIDNVTTPADLVAALLAQRAIQTIAASGAAQTLNVNTYAAVNLTLTANCTLTLTAPTIDGLYALALYVTQGNTGGWALTFPVGTLFDGGLQPTPATTLGNITKFVLTARRVATVTTWDVVMVADGLDV